MKFEIKNRFTRAVQVTAEIECDESESYSVKLGLAVQWAIKSGASLAGAHLVSADLNGANLRGVYLRGADLRGADLCNANLRGAYLAGADLNGADLNSANLNGANLNSANLTGADLYGANLDGANLASADLRGAYLTSADLNGADLNSANLDGLILIARATRADGYEYFAWTSILGGMVIKAGCRQWVGETAIEKARNHCRTITADKYRQEALDIIDYIEKRYGR
jgi:uncharacterized protein YjbI with pentapeptide repeats